jgi:hypothetical protein
MNPKMRHGRLLRLDQHFVRTAAMTMARSYAAVGSVGSVKGLTLLPATPASMVQVGHAGAAMRGAPSGMQSSAVQPKVLRRRSKVEGFNWTARLCRFARRPNKRQCCTTPPPTRNGRKARFRVTDHHCWLCHRLDDNFMEPKC